MIDACQMYNQFSFLGKYKLNSVINLKSVQYCMSSDGLFLMYTVDEGTMIVHRLIQYK